MNHARWTSRKFLTMLAAQITGILTLIFAEHEEMVVEASTNVTALLLMLGTAFGYISAEGKVDRESVRANAEEKLAETHLIERVRELQAEVNRLKAPAILLLGCLLFAASGCETLQSGTPLQKYAVLQDSYIEVVSFLVEARAAGDIEMKEWNEYILPLINEGDYLLDRIEEEARLGSSISANTLADSLRRVIRELLVRRLETQKGKEVSDHGKSNLEYRIGDHRPDRDSHAGRAGQGARAFRGDVGNAEGSAKGNRRSGERAGATGARAA